MVQIWYPLEYRCSLKSKEWNRCHSPRWRLKSRGQEDLGQIPEKILTAQYGKMSLQARLRLNSQKKGKLKFSKVQKLKEQNILEEKANDCFGDN